MENASKALIIAGAILLSILIIAIGIYIFNGANSTITESMSSMSTQEIEAFNNQFIQYEGIQSGTNVKSLIGKLISNANTNWDDSDYKKIPRVFISTKISTKVSKKNGGRQADYWKICHPEDKWNKNNTQIKTVEEYFEKMGYIRNAIEDKHEYNVEVIMGTSGLIRAFAIKYDSSDTFNNTPRADGP